MVRTAPAIMSAVPAATLQEMCSPSTNAARRMVNARLTLSMGATDDAGAICRALKYASHEIPVAIPDSARNSNDLDFMDDNARCSPLANTTPHANTRTTIVRMAVAR